MAKLSSFTELKVWQEAHKLAIQVYAITESFSEKDKFGLVSQMQRSALSVTSNIAEGFAIQSDIDSKRFYIMARGSFVELQNQLLLSRDVGKIINTKFQELADLFVVVHKLLHGLIRVVSVTK